MKIITEPAEPVTKYRKSVPPNVAAAVAKSLEKLPADRFESARAFADALANPNFANAATSKRAPPAMSWRRYAEWIIAAVAVIAIVSVGLVLLGRSGGDAGPVARFSLALPASQGLTAPGGTRLAWAPDGKAFVYVGPGSTGSQLWLRSLDALEAVPIKGTDGATGPFFSPDGSRVGYISLNPFEVRLVPIAGGTPAVVAKERASGGGASWGSDGFIYYDGINSLSRIHPDGTGREVVYALDSLQGEVGVAWPRRAPRRNGSSFSSAACR